ncbi:MAG: hypothetical protein MUE79_05185 [Nitratireductor sp.]|jgi:hypothetical protein|nr:hypothetical protein [Nitratireductor sp.]
MRKLPRNFITAASAGLMLALSVQHAGAQLAPLMLADWMIKKSNKEAAATPGHAEWCARQKPGYRPQWNNWRTASGTVTYCASPYYTPPWQVPYAKR